MPLRMLASQMIFKCCLGGSIVSWIHVATGNGKQSSSRKDQVWSKQPGTRALFTAR
jgi:hypothetical protein